MTTRSPFRILAMATLLLLAAPVASRAAEDAPEEPYKVRVNLAFFLGPQRYDMGDINKDIAATNAEFRAEPVLAAAGLELKDITSGFAYGTGIRVWPRRNVVLAFDYQRLTGSSSASVPVSSTPGAPSFRAEMRVPAQSLGLNVGYLFDWPSRKFRLGPLAGASYYICGGAGEVSFPGYHVVVEEHGKGFGAQGMVLADYALSGTVQIEAALGYRMGKTRDLKDRSTKLLNADGSNMQADYKGLITRFGVNIPFGPR